MVSKESNLGHFNSLKKFLLAELFIWESRSHKICYRISSSYPPPSLPAHTTGLWLWSYFSDNEYDYCITWWL